MESQHLDLKSYLLILRRRKVLILVTIASLFFLSVLVAFVWPPSYRSTATILIEEQQVPPDLVRAAITSYADQRIEKIKQQVMTRANLLRIIEEFNLYQSLRRRSTTEEVLEEFIEDILIEVISADVVDKQTGRQTRATIAFTLSYDGHSPRIAQKVSNELTNLFLAENLRSREEQAQETTAFLEREAEDLNKHIAGLEDQIADFKQGADGALPELFEVNMRLLNQAEQELTDLKHRLISLEDQHIHLQGQLEIIKPHTPMVTVTGERILDSEERLKALRAQHVSSAAVLSHDHPDIIKMEQEIEALEAATGLTPGTGELQKRLADEHASIQALLEQYGDDHPDVIRSRKVIGSLEKEIFESAQQPTSTKNVKPENPAYVQVLSQKNAIVNQIKSLKKTERAIRQKVDKYTTRLERTPELEPKYLELTRHRDNTMQKYHEVRLRLLEAQVSQEMEEQRKGERFSLIDPPDLPEKPAKPNRSAIIFLGLVVALGGGIGASVIAENLDHAIWSSQTLMQAAHVPPLSIIPFMPTEKDLDTMVKKQRTLGWTGIGAIVVCLLIAHFLWLPLDVAWYATLRRLGIG